MKARAAQKARAVVQAGLREGRFVTGTLRMNRDNAREGYVVASGQQESAASRKEQEAGGAGGARDVLLAGRARLNRATDLDRVVVEVPPRPVHPATPASLGPARLHSTPPWECTIAVDTRTRHLDSAALVQVGCKGSGLLGRFCPRRSGSGRRRRWWRSWKTRARPPRRRPRNALC